MHPTDFGKIRLFVLAMLTVLLSTAISLADVQTLISDLDKMATLEGEEFDRLAAEVSSRIEQDTTGVAAAIIPKLSEVDLTDNALAVYVAVLGQTGATEAIDAICRVAGETESTNVRVNCLNALGRIGTAGSGECMMGVLEGLSDAESRFEVFNVLAEMQFEAALPAALEVLESNAEEHYWRPIFVFGKFGGMAVPYLIEKISDENKNVRFNAIHVLGQWLISTEATQPLQERFWQEDDPVLRNLILSSVEKTEPDLDTLKKFFKRVKENADDEVSREFAKEAVELVEQMSGSMNEALAMKEPSATRFREAYDVIWASMGRDGDYEELMTVSTIDDEPVLKKLRRWILHRNSDECWYDYNRINDIINLNRILDSFDKND